ncbi:MAG: hypothetical protein JWO57_1687 [Pseudonocardiales bacterium]|nr:hypothetical protein [Pseudonocardiales bacterium]
MARDQRTTLRDRLTIVLLTFNCGHRIRPILEHLVDLDVAIIAVDNASADDTRAVLAEYPQLDVVAMPRNIGAAARNVGLARATTPYVALCDDDGWYEADGLRLAADLFDRYPALGLVNARILVRDEEVLDPISVEMAASPLTDGADIPGIPILGFMAGAVIVRAAAYSAVGGFDARFFIGGEEDAVAYQLARTGWRMRYVPDAVMHHQPSVANAPHLRAVGLRNALWTCWLHRRAANVVRRTLFTLADRPKNRSWIKGLGMALAGVPWVVRERRPMSRELDGALRALDRRHYAARRPFFSLHDEMGSNVGQRPPG